MLTILFMNNNEWLGIRAVLAGTGLSADKFNIVVKSNERRLFAVTI
jgi:hypothetical protein